MSNWDADTDLGEANHDKNFEVARRAFTMLICAHLFVLWHLSKNLPPGTEATVVRKRCVLVQVMPPSIVYPHPNDIFTLVFKSLCHADTKDILRLAKSMLLDMTRMGEGIFPHELLFSVIDKAQVAAEYLDKSSHSLTTGIDNQPVLHPFYRFLYSSRGLYFPELVYRRR